MRAPEENHIHFEEEELSKHIPYMLQDVWEASYSVKVIKSLISSHCQVSKETKILDLGCAVGILDIDSAKEYGCRVKGIDIVPEFISDAKKKAKQNHVDDLCEFQIEDINKSLNYERDYDIVIYSLVGDVLGNWTETALKLKNTINKHGTIIILDSVCHDSDSKSCPTRPRWLEIFKEAGLTLLFEQALEKGDVVNINYYALQCMKFRADELVKDNPEKADMLEKFLLQQQADFRKLEEEKTLVVWLLQ